jgi:hypothetical protein
MNSLRDVVLVLAGASAFHTVSHLVLGVSVALPLQLRLPHMTLTHRLNNTAVIVNALITAWLFWWATRL